MTQKSWFFKHRIMPKIIHHFFSLTFFLMLCVSSAFGAGYTCPTNRKYTTCNVGYYLAADYDDATTGAKEYNGTPAAGNACRPCSDYDDYKGVAEGSYYCAGKTAKPVLNQVTVTYNLNGGSGTAPSATTCEPSKSCTLASGATNSFYSAGFVFKGWSKSSSATTGSTSLTFTASTTVYAVWEPCGVGKYKEGSENADAECSACPEPLDGFVFDTGVIIATLPEQCTIYAYDLHPLNEWCASTPDDTSKQLLYALWGSDDKWHVFTNALAISVVPGAYANPDMFISGGSVPPPPGVEIESFDDLCLPCGDGEYSDGGVITACTRCPISPNRAELNPPTGGTIIPASATIVENWGTVHSLIPAAGLESCYVERIATDVSDNCDAGILRAYVYKSDSSVVVSYATSNPEVIEPFSAKPGAYVLGDTWPTCSVCEDGTYSDGGEIDACTVCPIPLQENFEWFYNYIADSHAGISSCQQVLWNPSLVDSDCANMVAPSGIPAVTLRYIENEWKYNALAVYVDQGNYIQWLPQRPVSYEVADLSTICEPCPAGTFNSVLGASRYECSACPDLPTGFVYATTTGLKKKTECSAASINLSLLNENCMDRDNAAAPVRLAVEDENASNWTSYSTAPTASNNLWAGAGAYVNPEMLTDGAWQPYSNFDADELCKLCPYGTYNGGNVLQTVTACTACPTPELENADEWNVDTDDAGATSPLQCYAWFNGSGNGCEKGVIEIHMGSDGTYDIENATTPMLFEAEPGYYVTGTGIDTHCEICSAGTYSAGGAVRACYTCPRGYDDNPETGLTSPDMCQISCPGGYYLAAANDATCSEVSPRYWAAAKIVNYGGTSTRTECASGLTTIGYGAGADEAADCGRVLHFGDDTLYLRSAKKTDHALHVGINGTVFYGNMGTDLTKGSLRIKLGDTTYSVYDDSM